MNALSRTFAAAVLGVVPSGVAVATEVVELSAFDRGFYGEGGGHSPSLTAYGVGANFGGTQVRNFFVFDLSDIDGEIVDAQLKYTFTEYESPDPFESYTLYDITIPLPGLLDGSAENDAYLDLGTGAEYGDATFLPSQENTPFLIQLNSIAIQSLNDAPAGLWGLGGAITTLDANPGTIEAMGSFGLSNDLSSTQLILTINPVPAPAGLPLLGSAMLFGRRRRRT